MGENEFADLFGGDDYAELADAMDKVENEVAAEKAAAAPKKDGVWYVNDEKDANGHQVSVYAINMGGKTILWATVDNDLEGSTEGLGAVPAGLTVHPITVWSADRTHAMLTKGVAVKVPHQDGTGNHIDGTSVRAYVIPRLTRYVGEAYGV